MAWMNREKVLRTGSSGDDVRELQDKLRRLGFDVRTHGVFDDLTERAVIELQALFGHRTDGIVLDATRRLIDAEIGYGWNVRLPNAQELALRSQGRIPGTDGGIATSFWHGRDVSQNVSEVPRAPTIPDAPRTAAPDLAGPRVAPGTSRPTGAPGRTPGTPLPKKPGG